MKRTVQILISLFLILQHANASDAERDIMEIAKERPLNVTVNGVPAKYGDPTLDAAVDALGDIPRPWTVPKIIEVFNAETAAWLRKFQAQIDKKSEQMWEGSDREEKRCGYLATLLAASRDPRAAVVLGAALDNRPEFPGAICVFDGLYYYFVRDPAYRQLPTETFAPYFSTNLFPEEMRRVEQWWALNKEELKASTKVPSK